MKHTYFPKPPLSHYINQFWLWEDYQPLHPRERILPAGIMELVINLSPHPIEMYYPNDLQVAHRMYGPLVSGARSEYFIVDTHLPTTVLGVWFKPGGAFRFFGVPARELQNRHVPLDTLWNATVAENFYNHVLEACTPEQRFCIVEQALLAQLTHAQEAHRAVNYALTAFNDAPHTQTVTQVLDQISLSHTRFIHLFGEEVGLTPKLFCRISRFQMALKQIVNQPINNWTDIALSCGYFDQAHLINDFQTFAGISPTLYAPQNIAHPSNLPVFE